MRCEVGVKHYDIKCSEWKQLVLFWLVGFSLFQITCQLVHPPRLLPAAALRRGNGCIAVPVPSFLQHDDHIVCEHLYASTLPAASCHRRKVGGDS